MTKEEIQSLKEGDEVYCSRNCFSHKFKIGEKLTRVKSKWDSPDEVCFLGNSGVRQHMIEDDISFTNPIFKSRKGWHILELLLSIAPAIINIFKKKK